jgi:hypothetical protein
MVEHNASLLDWRKRFPRSVDVGFRRLKVVLFSLVLVMLENG